MATKVAVETTEEVTESVRIDRVLLEVIREWAAASNRSVAMQVRHVLQPLCMAYLEGQRNGMKSLGQQVVSKLEDRTAAEKAVTRAGVGQR